MARRVVLALAGALVAAGLSWSTGRRRAAATRTARRPQRLHRRGRRRRRRRRSWRSASTATSCEAAPVAGQPGQFAVEVILSGAQADELADGTLTPGRTTAPRRRATALAGTPCSARTAGRAGSRRSWPPRPPPTRRSPSCEVIGQTVQGQDIIAVRVTRNVARGRRAGAPADDRVHRRPARPGVDHARDGPPPARPRPRPATAPIPTITDARQHHRAVVHPRRQPRRLRLHVRGRPAGCGARTCATTTATARSRPATASTSTATSRPAGATTTRARRRTRRARRTAAPAPASEPETQALDALFAGSRRSSSSTTTRPPSCCCTASAGRSPRRRPTTCSTRRWSATTPTRRCPATTPTSSAELYTTNGDTDTHMQEALRHARLHAGDVDVRDRRRPSTPTTSGSPRTATAASTSPTTRRLIQAEFEKNIPFALAVAESARRSRRPGVGRRPRHAETSASTRFDVSYGDPQTVAVTAKRALRDAAHAVPDQRRPDAHRRRPRVGGRRALRLRERRLLRRVPRQGPRRRRRRHGRGLVHRPSRSATARVRHASRASTSPTPSRRTPATTSSSSPTRTTPASTPTYPPSVAAPKYLDEHVAALRGQRRHARRLGRRRPGRAPRPRRAQPLRRRRLVPRRQPPDPGSGGRPDRRTSAAPLPDLSVAERQQYLTMAVRDFLNEGGKLVLRRRDGRLLRPARRRARRHLLRPRRRAGGGLRGRRSTPSATACCWPTTSPSTTSGAYARTPLSRRRGHRHGRTDRPASRRRSAARPPSTTRSTRPARSP